MKNKHILVLTILIASFLIVPTVYSKKGGTPFNELWEIVNDLIIRVTTLEEAGTIDISELEARVEALEQDLRLNDPPIIEMELHTSELSIDDMPYAFVFTIYDPEGDDFSGIITRSWGASIPFTQDDLTNDQYVLDIDIAVEDFYGVGILCSDEHAAGSNFAFNFKVVP